MKSLLYDVKRSVWTKGFLSAFVATLFTMLLSFGPAFDGLRYFVEEGVAPDWEGLIDNALCEEFSVLWLPALAALPFAAVPFLELKTKAVRPAVFRAGKRPYIFGKAMGCMMSGVLLQLFASLFLYIAFSALSVLMVSSGLPNSAIGQLFGLTAARALCGGIWALVGGLIALLSRTVSAAYIGPLCICYSLIMIGSRFFPQAAWVNPLNWVSQPDLWLIVLLAACGVLMLVTLEKRVMQYV